MNDKKFKIKHFMYVPFTGLGISNGFRGNKWLKNRVQIFKNFVFESLRNQTNKNFMLWVSWRPEEKFSEIVQEFEIWLKENAPFEVVFTYNGVCFWDDKYPDEIAHERLVMSITNSLFTLADYVSDVDFVYMTIQPSDDCYTLDAVEIMQSQSPVPKLMGWRKGLIIDYGTKEVAEYNPDTIPPFFTFVFQKADFINPLAHMTFTGPYKSHEYAGDKQHYTELPGRKFLVGTHGSNISTVFNHPFKGRMLEKEVLKEFGIYDAEPVIIRAKPHLLMRKMVNMMPDFVQDLLRAVYHKVR